MVLVDSPCGGFTTSNLSESHMAFHPMRHDLERMATSLQPSWLSMSCFTEVPNAQSGFVDDDVKQRCRGRVLELETLGW